MSFVSCFDRIALACLSITLAWGICESALAQTKPATTTTLSVTSSGSPVTTVAPGTVVTLTATVKAGSTSLTTGWVNFCDASVVSCSDIHLLSTVALTSGGTATFKFVPGPGEHSYKAEFLANKDGAASVSSEVQLSVEPAPSPVYSDTTSITDLGYPGAYSLTATVEGFGGPAPLTGNVSFVDTSFANTVLATQPLGSSVAGQGWLISQTAAICQYPIGEVAGDFNGDGLRDLAVLCSTGGDQGPFTITILVGKGDGTFTAGPTTQATGVQTQPSMIVGDFNGDGKADLAILSLDASYNGNCVTVLLGKGDGTFATPITSDASKQPSQGGDVISGSLVAADFNGDGKLDVAVVGDSVDAGGVTVLLGNGDGSFTAAGPSIEPDQGFGLVAAGDFNGDGIPDLVVANYSGGTTFTVLLGKGDGTFTAKTPLTFSDPADKFPNSIVVGDFNQDGKTDFAALDQENLLVFLGNGDGTFSQIDVPLLEAGEDYSLAAGDFNNDGKVDFAAIDRYVERIDMFLGAGDGTFDWIVTTPDVSQQPFLPPFQIVAADFNEDGVPDLAMLSENTSLASILISEPTQTATVTVNNEAPVGAGTHNVEASYAGNSSYRPAVSTTVQLTAGLLPVVISLPSGTYTTVQTVTLSESIPGATIYYSYYSQYGTILTTGLVRYTRPIVLSFGGYESIQAYATEKGYLQSSPTYGDYTLNYPQAPAPSFAPPAGSYPSAQSTTISDSISGATIYYTTNGTFPSAGATQYSGSFAIPSSETVSATAIATGYSLSLPASAEYFIDSAASSFIYTVAGNGTPGYAGDGGPAALAKINSGVATVEDKAGNLYIADANNNVVREVAAGTGIITTFAGNGTPGYSGDGGPANKAQLQFPLGLSFDGDGNLYIADNGNKAIRRVSAADGTISTYLSSLTSYISGIAADGYGNLYLADLHGNTVLKVAAGTRAITTYAGTGQSGYSGDGGPAKAATFREVAAVATDSSNNVYIADSYNNVIRKVNAGNQTISTVAGDGFGAGSAGDFGGGYGGDGGPATQAELYYPIGVAVDRLGNVYISDQDNERVREVSASSGTISTIAGNGGELCLSGGGETATNAGLCGEGNISVDLSGNLYLSDLIFNRIQEVTAPVLPPTTAAAAPQFSIAAGMYDSPQTVSIMDATPGAAIYITLDGSTPTTLSRGYKGPIDVSGNLTISAIAVAPGYLPSAPVSAAYTITSPPTATIATIAGTGASGFSRGGGTALSVYLGYPAGIALDNAGNIYFADPPNFVVWKLSAQSGDLSVVAGNGTYGYGSVSGPATDAALEDPVGVAVDSSGNLYIADQDSYEIDRVAAGTGIITTYAGTGLPGYGNRKDGDGGPAVDAAISPQSIAVDRAGNLYIADNYLNSVRVVNAATGIITTFAGNGTPGYSGDGGPATKAGLDEPNALAIDSSGNLFVSTGGDGRIREVAAATGIITTVAGNGDPGGLSGDGGPATSAEVAAQCLATDSAGNVYLFNNPGEIRQIAVGTGVITAAAGNGYYGYSGDGGSATVAEISNPSGIATDPAGNLYLSDSSNYRIREVTFTGPVVTPVFSLAGGTYGGRQNVTIYDGTPGATVYYTADGTMPSSKSSVYSAPIAVASSQTLEAIAILNGRPQSGLATAAYTITAATPVISPAPGSYVGAQSVTISDASPGATIYYTTDGVTVPSTRSAVYTGPITVMASETIMAIAVASGFPNSAVVSAAYIIRYRPVLNWTAPAEIMYGTELGTKQLDAGASVPGSFAYSPKTGTRLIVGVHTLSVTFTPSNAAIYTTATKSVEITVKKAMLTVTAKKASKVYGAPVPRLMYTITGFDYGETAEQTVSGKPGLTTKATAKSKVGIYPITASAGNLKSQNYEFRFVDAHLTVTKAGLTFAAKNASVESGKPLPKLTYSIEGFVKGDTVKVLSGKPIESTTAKQGSPPGVYPITIKVGTLKAENYSFGFKDAKLTITKP